MTTASGMLLGIGLGPGDSDLITLKGLKALQGADIVAYFAKAGRVGHARTIVAPHLCDHHREVPLYYPVTTEIDRHHQDYTAALREFYRESAAVLAAHLDQGRTVAVIAEGDPMFYGSYMHLHVRLAPHYPTQVIPGITAMSGSWSSTMTPTCQGDEVLSILPGTLEANDLQARLAQCEAAVIMKVGRHLGKVRQVLADSGRLDRAWYIERATQPEQKMQRLADKPGDDAPYFSLVLVPGAVAFDEWRTPPEGEDDE